jgi:DNA-binding XRE family transcriptional regulator
MLQVSSYSNSNCRNCSLNCPAYSFQISKLYSFNPRKSETYVSLSKSENVIFSFPSRISLSRFPHKSRKANRSISLWCIPITLLANNSLLRNIIKSETSKINIKFLYCEIFKKWKDFMIQKIRPDMDIGKNIQAIRYANKLTQDQVVAKLNLMGISMSKSTYAKLETNRMNIKVSELVALAKIFHTDINAFFSGLL